MAVSISARGEVRSVTFNGAFPEQKWPVAELAADMPTDWSGYDSLVLEMKASSPQKFEIRLYTAAGMLKAHMQPYSGAWIRASIPLALYKNIPTGSDLASVSNKPFPLFFINLMGSHGPINAVEALAVAMEQPIGSPTLEIRSIQLSKEPVASALLEPGPLVDEFGQWTREDWPGKAKSLDDLKRAWAAEDKSLAPAAASVYSRYGGYVATQSKATGFFRVEQTDGKWWLIDPEGHQFFSVGADCMRAGNGTPTRNRDGVFAALPPEEANSDGNQRRGQRAEASFYTWNLMRRFGPEWQPAWIDATVRRMDAWGLNTIACWSDNLLFDSHRKPYVYILRGWNTETMYMGLPDVYSPQFAQRVEESAAQQCAPRKDDPWLIGYFIGNEPPWPGRESQLVDMILAGPANDIQREARDFLAAGDSPQRRKQFIYRAFEKYLQVICDAVRKNDPNHMNIGQRFGSRAPDEMLKACSVFDVFSMNNYAYNVNHAEVERAHRLSGRPVMIGEFHFGTPGRGMAAGLKQTKDQAERGVAYQYYVEDAAAMPMVVGVHWFQWTDQPNSGRFDGENYNIGIIDVTDRPYPEFVKAMQQTHGRLFDIHSGKQQPTTRKGITQ